ncbi:hypothetical protein [Harryflintia acetispora]|uniref:hypothetical protein n=1 Tax=Harryflintia acetispora TaxID=1849041 RepID=UPI0010468892|nr:hypothetical protein [Harryflintia acetispora]
MQKSPEEDIIRITLEKGGGFIRPSFKTGSKLANRKPYLAVICKNEKAFANSGKGLFLPARKSRPVSGFMSFV